MTFKELEKELLKAGYTRKQKKSGGSHYVFIKKGCRPEVAPNHGSKDLSTGLVRDILKRIRACK